MNEFSSESQETVFLPPVTPAFTPKKKNTLIYILLIVLLLGLAGIYYLHFFHKPKSTIVAPTLKSGEVSLAYINSDTLWEQYEFVKQRKAELEATENRMQGQYDYQYNKFQTDYETYIKKATAGQLTLDQQKKTEAELSKRQEEIMGLDKKLTQQFLEMKETMNKELQDTILHYIDRYNKKQKFTFILEYSRLSGILWADPALDITSEIVNGLNQEYQKWKKK